MHGTGSGGNKGGSAGGVVVQKFNSRRGCFNTLTFPEMDFVPLLFKYCTVKSKSNATDASANQSMSQAGVNRIKIEQQMRQENTCVITCKKARYRDPKTKKGYHDLEAFRELRRRYDAGEPLESKLNLDDLKSLKELKEDGNHASGSTADMKRNNYIKGEDADMNTNDGNNTGGKPFKLKDTHTQIEPRIGGGAADVVKSEHKDGTLDDNNNTCKSKNKCESNSNPSVK